MATLKLWYNRVFKKHLFLTNTVSCCTLMGLGDWIQQRIHNGFDKTPNDWKRTARMATMGLALGPMAHVWYGILDRMYKVTTAKVVVKKIIWDQIIASPAFSFTFITGMCLLEGQELRSSLREFVHKFPTIYLMDWCIWPPTQAINFYFMPPQFRVIYVTFIDLIWYTFNSYIKHKEDVRLRVMRNLREMELADEAMHVR